MAAPVIGRRKNFIPPKSAVIDRTHPLAENLEFCVIPAVNTTDLAKALKATTVGAPTRAVSKWGTGNAYAGGTDYHTYSVNDTNFLGPISIFVLAKKTAGSKGCQIVSKSTGAAQSDPLTLEFGSGGSITFYRSNGTTDFAWAGPNFTTGTDYAIGVTCPATPTSTLPFYVNGTYTTSSSNTWTGSVTGNNAVITLTPNLTASATVVTVAAIWSRVLSDAEMAQLYADPFCFLRW